MSRDAAERTAIRTSLNMNADRIAACMAWSGMDELTARRSLHSRDMARKLSERARYQERNWL